MNPSQKSGNYRARKAYKKKGRKGDYRTKMIARQEAKKVVAKKIESKVFDDSQTVFDISGPTYSIFDLTAGISRGPGDKQFIGDSIQPTHLRIRWAIAQTGNDRRNIVRVILIQNKGTAGVPIAGTLLQSSGTILTPLSAYETDYNETYKVLFDEFYSMTGNCDNAAEANETSQLVGDIRILSNKLHKITYTATGSISSGGLYLCFFSDSTAPSGPLGQYFSRLYYKDA